DPDRRRDLSHAERRGEVLPENAFDLLQPPGLAIAPRQGEARRRRHQVEGQTLQRDGRDAVHHLELPVHLYHEPGQAAAIAVAERRLASAPAMPGKPARLQLQTQPPSTVTVEPAPGGVSCRM